MRFTSRVIPNFARALVTGEPEPGDSFIQIRPELHPIIEIPQIHHLMGGILAADVQSQSFTISLRQTRAASSAELTTTVCTFGPGLWRVRITLAHFADFTSTPIAGSLNRLLLADPNSIGAEILGMFSIANQPQIHTKEFQWALAESGWIIQATVGATGVAQTQLQVALIDAALLT